MAGGRSSLQCDLGWFLLHALQAHFGPKHGKRMKIENFALKNDTLDFENERAF